MIKALLRALCNHDTKHLAIRTIEYKIETISSTAIDREIYCKHCGKVFIEPRQFDTVRRLLNGN